MNISSVEWLQNWFQNECNGDWEHTFGIKIETLDNPGWLVKIDLSETDYENIVLDTGYFESNDEDWYRIKLESSIFKGVGDLSKLEFLLNEFRSIIEKYPTSSPSV